MGGRTIGLRVWRASWANVGTSTLTLGEMGAREGSEHSRARIRWAVLKDHWSCCVERGQKQETS